MDTGVMCQGHGLGRTRGLDRVQSGAVTDADRALTLDPSRDRDRAIGADTGREKIVRVADLRARDPEVGEGAVTGDEAVLRPESGSQAIRVPGATCRRAKPTMNKT